jgi:hypothetical protein
VKAFGADFNDVFAFERIEEFVFIVVKMAGRTSLLLVRLLHDEQGTAGILRQNPVGGWSSHQPSAFFLHDLPRRARGQVL